MKSITGKILIAEDESKIRETLGELVSTIVDGEIELAEDGKIALGMIQENPLSYSIILTDLKMPNLDGIELMRFAREINKSLIFIVITGFATKDNAISALKQGAYDFVHKPFNINEFTAVLNRAIDHYNLLEENRNYQKNLESLIKQRTIELETLNEDLQKLLLMDQRINILQVIEDKIDEYQANIIERFKPSTALLLLYDNFTGQFSLPWIHSEKGSTVKLPDSFTLLADQKFYFYSGNEGSKKPNEILHLNQRDKSFFLAKLEHEVFLGYFYLGFKSISTFKNVENPIKLYVNNLESILYSHYLQSFHRREMETMFISGIKAISDTVEASSSYTRKHSDRVEKYAGILAQKLNFSYERKYILKIACILHDIGKVGIEKDIVYKPERLTDEEMEIMRRHPVVGANIVKGLYGFKIDHIVRSHHERWDGKGYPDGLVGEETPLESRIIAIADAFDAMITSRPYRHGRPIEEALEELESCAKTQFDPYLVKKFIEAVEEDSSIMQILKTEARESQYDIDQTFNSR